MSLTGLFSSTPPVRASLSLKILEQDRLGLLECRRKLKFLSVTVLGASLGVEFNTGVVLGRQLGRLGSLRHCAHEARLALEAMIQTEGITGPNIASLWNDYYEARVEFNRFASGIHEVAKTASSKLPDE